MAKKELRGDAKALAEAWLNPANVNLVTRTVQDQPSKKLAAGLALEIYVWLRAMDEKEEADAFQRAIYNRAIT